MVSVAHLLRLMTPPRLSANVRLGPEDQIGVALASELRVATLQGRMRGVWTHVSNEVGFDRSPAARKKANLRYAMAMALGLTPGCADYLFLWSDGAGAIELKSKTGRQTDVQRDFERWCSDQGVPYRVARSVGEALDILIEWGVLRD